MAAPILFVFRGVKYTAPMLKKASETVKKMYKLYKSGSAKKGGGGTTKDLYGKGTRSKDHKSEKSLEKYEKAENPAAVDEFMTGKNYTNPIRKPQD